MGADDVSEQNHAFTHDGDFIEPLRRMGLLKAGERARLTPLSGGVSSDILLVETGGWRFCVKRALPKLKVAALWEAPVERNAAEAAWMRAVARWLPRAVPRVLGEDAKAGLFAMDYLAPEDHRLWKSQLLAGYVEPDFAAAVGRDLAIIHARSAADPSVREAFANDDTFEAIRIEPYLRATGRAHSSLAPRFDALARTTLSTKRALVHGDVSPKNILQGPLGPVFLDAECAWFGDPAFDLAFCLNHLLLKGARDGADRTRYGAAFSALAQGYLAGVDWESADGLEARAAALLPALFLARSRRQVAGRIPHPGERAGGRAPRSRAADRRSAASPDGRRRRMDRRAMSQPVIRSLVARRIWDSRGRPTVEAEVALSDGAVGRGIAPAGASRGSREAIDKRDGGKRLGGLDVQNALEGMRTEIAPALAGLDPFDQSAIDARLIALDGTPNKARLGGNALTAVSLAVLHAAAASRGLPLWRHCLGDQPAIVPLPEIQIFGGGAHAGRRTDVQDFMVVAPRAKTFAEALAVTADVYHAAGAIMAERGLLQGVADEGGWWPAFSTNEEALETLIKAIERAGLAPGTDAAISLDVAASEFGQGGRYRLGLERRELDRDALAEMLIGWCARYPILSIEDPFAEDDDEGFEQFTAAVGDRIQVIGDDYLVTSLSRVREAERRRSVNAALIKVNQAGTVSEAKAACDEARRFGWGTIVSARSGETEDTSIVHLAIGWGAGQLKVGSFARSERMAKWNEGLRIEEALGPAARFAGLDETPLRRQALKPI